MSASFAGSENHSALCLANVSEDGQCVPFSSPSAPSVVKEPRVKHKHLLGLIKDNGRQCVNKPRLGK